ncbi:hypothetical protein V491_08720, partial [Pseudogymnoascus sp. VKM F-3775]
MSNTSPTASARPEAVDGTQILRFSTSTLQGSKQWVPLVAGGAGGVTAAILTAPLDVLRTRLQSEFYRHPAPSSFSYFSPSSSSITVSPHTLNPARHIRSTLNLLTTIHL